MQNIVSTHLMQEVRILTTLSNSFAFLPPPFVQWEAESLRRDPSCLEGPMR